MAERGLSRRAVLAGIGAVMGGLAGCGQAPAATPTPFSPIVETVFDGPELVVSLRDDHDVSRLNLIGPDGELFTSTEIAVGETTARLELLNIDHSIGIDHYTTGVQTLVAVGVDRNETRKIELRPELRIVGVEQYRTGNSNSDWGRLAVTIENIGSGPTWVYDITYRDAPNWTANNELNYNFGDPVLGVPNETQGTAIEPGSILTFVGKAVPLLYRDDPNPTCMGEAEFSVIVKPAVGDPIVRDISATNGGEVKWVGLTDDYTCSTISITQANGTSNGVPSLREFPP